MEARAVFEKVRLELDLEAEDHDGIISKRALEEIFDTYWGDRRAHRNKLRQLKAIKVLVPVNQNSYRYQPNGYSKELMKEAEQ